MEVSGVFITLPEFLPYLILLKHFIRITPDMQEPFNKKVVAKATIYNYSFVVGSAPSTCINIQ